MRGWSVSDLPLVTIVTPCLNSARYLEEAIQSVLRQDYPRIEYIVMDGGSTDGSLEILRRYEGKLVWYSGPDRGQSDAINQGFLRSHGSIFGFLCADDAYLPGAVSTAVRNMPRSPEYAGVYGEGWLVDASGKILTAYPTRPFDAELFQDECFICQPATFLWREAFAEVGMLDPGLHYGLDYDLWIRLARKYKLLKLREFLAVSRMHAGAKTLRHRAAVYRGNIRVLRRHFSYVPFRHIYGYACSLLDSRDGFFEPVPPSLGKYLLAVVIGSRVNYRHLKRFWTEALREALRAVRRGVWPDRSSHR